MDPTSLGQEFDTAVEQCTGDIIEFFSKLNDTGTEKTYEEVTAVLDKFDAFRAAIENSVRRKTVAWLRPWNSLAPAHKLPIEVLQHIFHFVLFGASGRRRRHFVARLTVLRSISSIWRDVTDRTPSLWTQLSSQDHIGFVSEALSKSQNYSLQLKYVGVFGSAEPSPFLDKAFMHLDRWETVVIQDPHGLLMEEYFACPAPRLKRLVASTQTGGIYFGRGPPPLLFGGEWATLEELRAVRWKNMDWTDVHCYRLRALEIEDYFFFDMEKLFSILAENLDLRTLRIHSITFRDDLHPQQAPDPLILRHLTDFTFTGTTQIVQDTRGQVGDTPVVRMLQRVQIPACTFFCVDFRLSGDALLSEFLNLIPSPLEIFQRRGVSQGFNPEPPTARVTFQAGEFQCAALGNPKLGHQYRVVVRGVTEIPRAPEEWVRRELVDAWTEGTKPQIQLRCWIDEEITELDDIFGMQDIGSVVELDVVGSSDGNGLARRLATAVASDNGSLIGPFLGLRTLRLSNCGLNGTEVLRMVQDRYAQVTNPASIAGQTTTEGDPSIPTEEGITIMLGEGMDRISRSIAREIRETPGVKELIVYSELAPTDDGSSGSSEESVWSPYLSDASEETDLSSHDGMIYDIGELQDVVE
ncbi:hypothetical protein FS837_005515 [Tulasnella sp. UAMH 9824]|nr:hypothetical protein FS837_005515 [Tulasnella sp. UAMH 9824]